VLTGWRLHSTIAPTADVDAVSGFARHQEKHCDFYCRIEEEDVLVSRVMARAKLLLP
jgi:hypothetical protein